MKRMILLATSGIVLCLITVSTLLMWQILRKDALPHPIEVLIPSGTSSARIGDILMQSGIIHSSFSFRLYVAIGGKSHRLQSGYYRFNTGTNIVEITHRINSGDSVLFRTTIPEGLRTTDILARLARNTDTPLPRWQHALTSLLHGQAEEGVLLPETYTYKKPIDPDVLLKQMFNAQKRLLQTLASTEKDVRKLRIMASIIEKETAKDTERPLIAAVILNRLKKSMALQMDPTVIYGLWRADGVSYAHLHKQDMKRDTPWNTYLHKGLPPTPICNPGKASLVAAAQAADVDFLYFVADGTGGHRFSRTFEEHQQHVRQWIGNTTEKHP